ncbi:MAG: glutathione S-transferase family protein [Pseudomonadota bacterium]
MKPQESIQIYGRRNSLNVQKAMWTLGELNLPYQRHDVGGSFGFPEEYAELNPNRVVPTLRDGDLVLWESGAIVRYLARRYGMGTLWPEDPATAAHADQWMDWHKDKVSFGFFDIFINRIRLGAEDCDETAVQRGIRLCAKQFVMLDEQLSKSAYLAGAEFTFGDVPMGAMTWRYLELDIDRPPLPNVERWQSTLLERPAFRYHVAIPFGGDNAEWNALEAAGAGIQ